MENLNELIPGLPEEIALECLTRVHYGVHDAASNVCQQWRHLLQCRDFYYHRKRSGFTRKRACFVQSLLVPVDSDRVNSKPENQPKLGLTMFEPGYGTWDHVNPVPEYPNGLPLFCRLESSEGKLVLMGGWNPNSWEPLRDVFTYNFSTGMWTQRVRMPSTRSFFATGAHDGKIYVAGGHDEYKNALKTAWVYDITADKWTVLAPMSEERDECEGVFIGSEFWVISGYDTDTQGQFKTTADVLDTATGRWRCVENAWGINKCPRACITVGQNENFSYQADSDPAIQVGSCVVDLGDRIIITGSSYPGGPQTFIVAEKDQQEKSCRLVKVDTPVEFSGFVQSGCFVEI